MKYVYKIILLALLTTVASIAKVPNHSNIDSIDIGLKECRLSINKSVRGALHFGETGTYDFTITNTGNGWCKGIILRDRLPKNVQYAGSQGDWNCYANNLNPQLVQCLRDPLAPYTSSHFSIDVDMPDQANGVGYGWVGKNTVKNCARIYPRYLTPVFSSASKTQPQLDLSRSCVTTEVQVGGECRLDINKSVRGELQFGEEGTYDFNITNTGNAPCRSVIVRDMLPNNVQYTDTQGDWSCSASTTNPQVVHCTLYSSLAPHASSQFSINVTIPDQENAVGIGWRDYNVTNCASVQLFSPISTIPPSFDFSRTSCVTTEVEEPIDSGECRLDINKSVNGTLHFGEAGEYLIEVSNISSHLCYGIYVQDTLPEGMTYSGPIFSEDWACQTNSNNPQTVTCHYQHDILNPGAVSTLLLPVEIPEEENAEGAGWGEENNVTNCASVYDVYDGRSLEQLYATDCTTNGVANINNTQDRPFKLKVDTNIESFGHPHTQFRISTNTYSSTINYNYNVDCDSDGINEAEGVTANYTCVYETPGIYTISISGVFPQIRFRDYLEDDNKRVISLEQWGTIEWKSMSCAFLGTINMEGNAPDRPNLSSVTNMSFMFAKSKFNQDISDWDVSHVTNMNHMFDQSKFNQDIGDWDVSSVTNMKGMFRTNYLFNQDIGDWNVSSVTDMSYMFTGSTDCNSTRTSFNQDISGWDVSNVTQMDWMFRKSEFNQDIGDWNVSNVTSMRSMFSMSPFNQDISGWNVSSVTNMSDMFYRNYLFNQDISGWNVSSVTNMSRMFSRATAFSNHDLSGWDVENVSNHILFLYQAGSGNTEPIWQ